MKKKFFNNLSGKILIASPYALDGNIFYKSLIYILFHSKDGALGLVLNRVAPAIPMPLLFKSFSHNESAKSLKLPVHIGGPTELERVFFLHSDDYNKNLLFKFPGNLAVSSNIQILKDISEGKGPKDSIFILGYTSWKPGEMEYELENNFWIISELEQDLVFSKDYEEVWNLALKKVGVSDKFFTSSMGHA